MKLHFKTSIILLFLLSSGFLVISNNPITDIIEGIQKYYQGNYQEKVYLQTDTDIYNAGDVIWFTTRSLDARDHSTSRLSKVVHVKLFNSNKQELYHKKVLTSNGIGNSDIMLADSLSTGVYYMYAYTEWMKNFSQDYFFTKEIYIVKEGVDITEINSNDHQLDVRFFPEGGTYIEGLNNQLGFKVIGSNGIGVEITGTVVNDNSESILEVNTYKYGHGRFVINPKKNTSYYLLVNQGGKTTKFKLPEPEKEGINLTVNATENGLIPVELQVTKGYLKELKKVLLVSHCRGIVNYAAEGKASSNSILDIPKSKLSAGINQITVFDQDGNPLIERLIFLQPKNESSTSLTGINKTYDKRSKVEFTIDTKLSEDANVTISVHDRNSLSKSNIKTYLLLSSDLKGHIENPDYYFQNSDSALIAADNLMLTQGWRRFNWKDIKTANDSKKQYPAENIGPIFRGKLIDRITNKPVSDTLIILSELNSNPNYLFNRLTANDEFIFNLHKMYGRDKIYVNVFGQDSINQFQLLASDEYNPFVHDISTPSRRINSAEIKHYAFKAKEDLILNNYRIYKPETSINWSIKNKEDIFRVGQSLESPDYSINPEEYIELKDLAEMIREIVPGTTIRKEKGHNKIYVYEYEPLASAQRDIAPYNKEPATVFLNGVPIFNEDVLFEELEYSNIKNVDVYIGQYDIADHKFYGFISITTKDIYSVNSMLTYASNVINYDGISLCREYYSPKYKVENPYEDRTPDFRHLLYWKPSLTIKANQPSTVSFYTSDVQGEFYINVEGISFSGKPIIENQKILVKNNNSNQ